MKKEETYDPTGLCPTILCPTVLCPTVICPTVICPTVSCPTVLCPTVICPTVICPTVICPTIISGWKWAKTFDFWVKTRENARFLVVSVPRWVIENARKLCSQDLTYDFLQARHSLLFWFQLLVICFCRSHFFAQRFIFNWEEKLLKIFVWSPLCWKNLQLGENMLNILAWGFGSFPFLTDSKSVRICVYSFTDLICLHDKGRDVEGLFSYKSFFFLLFFSSLHPLVSGAVHVAEGHMGPTSQGVEGREEEKKKIYMKIIPPHLSLYHVSKLSQ